VECGPDRIAEDHTGPLVATAEPLRYAVDYDRIEERLLWLEAQGLAVAAERPPHRHPGPSPARLGRHQRRRRYTMTLPVHPPIQILTRAANELDEATRLIEALLALAPRVVRLQPDQDS
jgi:hypothetical protein